MKSVLFVLALIVGSGAMASQNCNPYAHVPDGETAGSESTYACQGEVTHRGCIEGEVAYDSVFNGEFYQQVPVVCHNGSFAAPAAPVAHRGCNEGERAYTSVFNGEFYQQVPVVCHDGRFVRTR